MRVSSRRATSRKNSASRVRTARSIAAVKASLFHIGAPLPWIFSDAAHEGDDERSVRAARGLGFQPRFQVEQLPEQEVLGVLAKFRLAEDGLQLLVARKLVRAGLVWLRGAGLFHPGGRGKLMVEG